MGDSENNLQPSKKRAAGVQLSRDNPGLDDDDETSDQETGTFKRASEDVLATRRIVKVRRQQTSSTPAASAPSTASNPFAAIRLVPPPSGPPEEEAHIVQSKETKQIDESKSESKSDGPRKCESSADEKTDVNDDNCKQSENKAGDSEPQQKDENDDISNQEVDKSVKEEAGGGNFGDGVKSAADCDTTETLLANKDVKDEREKNEKVNGEATAEKNAETAPFNSFHQLSSSQNAFSGLSGTGFSSTSFSFGSISQDGSTFSFGNSNNESSSIFGTSSANSATKSEGSKFPPMQEVPVETGEENEKAVFTSDSVIFEFIDGGWKERGKGELKVNVSTTGTGKARLVMRARGNYRLILNASLFPDMKLTNMDKKGVTFACVNSAGEGKKDGLSTFALKFKDSSIVEDFRAAVMEHKSVGPVAVKTPENSPNDE